MLTIQITTLACLTATAVAEGQQANSSVGAVQIIEAILGVILFVVALIVFLKQRKQKAYVEFESFQVPTPSDVEKDIEYATKSTTFTTGTTTNMKEVSFEEGSSASPGERKKRKRKAHRLSDRRRNLEDHVSEQIEQNSQL